MADWFGFILSLIIVLSLIVIVIAKLQGDTFVAVLQQIWDFIKGVFGK
jgi:hypothetical protein